MTTKAARAELDRAMRTQRHVRVLRSARYAEDIDGFVVAVGAKWALIAVTEDGGRPAGLTVVRIRDVDQTRRLKSFEEAYARKLPSWPPKPPEPVDLDSTQGAIASLRQHGGLLAIQQEDRLADCMWVGRVDEVSDGRLWLHEIDQRARWHPEPLGYRLRNITTITVASPYLLALAAVAPRQPH